MPDPADAHTAPGVSGLPGGEPLAPVWLSHHRIGEEERCVLVRSRHVCRRCLWLWPTTFAVLAVSAAVGLWPASWDAVALAVLPLPAVVEFLGEVRGRVAYDPRRQAATALLLALALGRGFDRYLLDPGDTLFWNMVVVYGGICGVVMWWSRPRPFA
jgi:hypothetical protein